MAGLEQLGRSLKTNPRAATREQDVSSRSGTALLKPHGDRFRHQPILLTQLLAQGRHDRTGRTWAGLNGINDNQGPRAQQDSDSCDRLPQQHGGLESHHPRKATSGAGFRLRMLE
jgi:hypothetical protein